MSNSNFKTEFINGMRAGSPIIFGFIPVGIAFAIMARQAGFSILQTCGFSINVYAGASQMMAVGMHNQGASIFAIILATFFLNFRHLIMSTCVFERMQPASSKLKLLASFGVTDESFALFTTEKEERCTIAYFLGMNCVMYTSWNLGTCIGAIASDFLPVIITASFGIAFYAMFIALLTPNIKTNFRLGILVVLTAICNTALVQIIPPSWAMIISTLVCAFIGIFTVDLDSKEEPANE
ncbi:MAG: AzlC family ABC transporter permease [Phascolarctobacterium sp.]|nr:AzlC family ABC transporter permease [Phascolarctobacterium sp.]